MEKKLRFGILGCGLFGTNTLIPAFSEAKFAELVAITKRSESDAEMVAKKNGIPKWFSESKRADFLKQDLDAIFIASPNVNHMKDTIEVLEAGKHVLLEKPMAMNKEECLKIIDKEKESGCKVMIAHCMRFTDVVAYFKDLIDTGKIGSLVSITADFMSTGAASKRTWKFAKAIAGGGAAFDLGVHMIDTIRYLANSDLEEVRLSKIPAEPKADEVDLVSSFLLRFKNNVIGRTTASYFGPRITTLEIYGEKGMARVYNWNSYPQNIKVEQNINGVQSTQEIFNSNFYTKEIDSFAQSIIENKPLPVPSTEGLRNQEIIDLVN